MKPFALLHAQRLNLQSIYRSYSTSLAVTWGLVLLENILLALIPLFMGLSIDSLLAGNGQDLAILGGVMLLLTLVAVGRRIYDTRIYGTIRVDLGLALNQRQGTQPVSVCNARLDMGRELVDFLEQEVPALLTGVIQIVVSLLVLASFGWSLALSAVLLCLFMLLLYRYCHPYFLTFNRALNSQAERQVALLATRRPVSLRRHLRLLRGWEVKLSDTEAILYGGIFVGITGFILINLWLATTNGSRSAGQIFTIVSYSWEYVEAALVLPVTLQSLSRLEEVTHRINNEVGVNDQPAESC